MKKYLKLSIATFFLALLAVFIPKAIASSVTRVEVVFPSQYMVSDDIYTSGAIEEIAKKEIYAELPIVPEKVNFQIGDYVKTSDVIATVDVEATKAALIKLVDSSKLIPEEYLEVLGSINVDFDSLKGYIPTEIVSPTSGVVTEINLLEGAIITPKSIACTISRADTLRIRMSVEEINADKLTLGDTVVFKSSATGDTKYTGTITTIFPAATKMLSGTSQVTAVPFYVRPDANYSRLKPGYTVSGAIKKGFQAKKVTIPYEAVMQSSDNKEYIYTIKNSRAVRKDIITGEEFFDCVQVISGISEDTAIIKNAASIKKDNAAVKF